MFALIKINQPIRRLFSRLWKKPVKVMADAELTASLELPAHKNLPNHPTASQVTNRNSSKPVVNLKESALDRQSPDQTKSQAIFGGNLGQPTTSEPVVIRFNQPLESKSLNSQPVTAPDQLTAAKVKPLPAELKPKLTPQISQAIEEYVLALKLSHCSRATVRNYKSDIRQFCEFAHEIDLDKIFTKPKLLEFAQAETNRGLQPSTVKRKLVSIAQFAAWARKGKLITDRRLIESLDRAETADLLKFTAPEKTSPSKVELTGNTDIKPIYQLPKFNLTNLSESLFNRWLPYFNLLVLAMFVLGLGIFTYRQFRQTDPALAYPTTLTRPSRMLSFQGRLTNTGDTPITDPTAMRFKLYNDITAGTLLWDSNSCTITPDQDGIFSANLGAGAGAGADTESCGAEVADHVFTNNSNVWLQVTVGAETLTPRQPIRTVAYALNAETLQGFPASASAVENTVLIMNNSGEVVLGNTNPKIKATGTTMTLEGKSLTLQSTSGSTTDVSILADRNVLLDAGTGGLIDAKDFIAAPGATLSANAAASTALTLKAGPTATADIAQWQNSGGTVLGKITKDGQIGVGNITPEQDLNVASNLQLGVTDGTRYVYFDNGTGNNAGIRYDSATDKMQFSNDGTTWTDFGAGSGGVTSVSNVDGTLTISPTTGVVVASLDLSHANTWTGIQTFSNTLTANGIVGLGDGGDTVTINSSDWDIGATGDATGLGAITADGILTLSNSATMSGTLTVGNGTTNTIKAPYGSLDLAYKSGADTWGTGLTLQSTTGNVGVGTVDPRYPLEVRRDQNAISYMLVKNSTTGTGAAAGIAVVRDGTAGMVMRAFSSGYTTSGLDIANSGQFRTDAGLTGGMVFSTGTTAPIIFGNNSTEAMRLTGGNLGVGTTGPDAKLDSLATTEQLRLTYTDGTVYSAHTVDASGNLTINNTGTKTIIADDLQITGGDILDSNGNESIRFGTTASAVDEVTITNAAANGIVTLAATGGDADIALSIDAKGADALNLNNTGTGDVLLAGGSGATGCTVANATGNLVCTGTISGSGIGASSVPFSGITSATNTTAAMVVGAGASLDYTSTGTINASTLIGATWVAPGAIGSTTPNSGAFTTLSSTGTTTIGDAIGDAVTVNSGAWTLANDTDFALTGGVNGLSFDTNTLSIDGLNNRVGIGNAAPGYALDVTGGVNLTTGNAYTINGTSVLNATTLGSAVVTSSLTTVGALASGSIASGFGTITTANTITGTVLNGTTSLNTGAGAGTARVDVNGNLTNIGTTQFNTQTLTWPAGAGSSGYILATNGSGTLSWADPTVAGAATEYWNVGSGSIFLKNTTQDFLLGSQATSSAKFSVLNMSGTGTPTASISGTTANVRTFLTGEGDLSTTNRASLTLGNSAAFNSTGNILLNPNGTGNVGIGTTNPTNSLHVVNNSAIPVRFERSNSSTAQNSVSSQLNLYNPDITTSNYAALAFATKDSGGTASRIGGGIEFIFTARDADSATGDFAFMTVNNTSGLGEEKLRITSAGNVGIGTTGPDAKLDSLSTTEQLRLTYTDGTVFSSHTVDAAGDLTIDNTGTKTIIADNFQVTGTAWTATPTISGLITATSGLTANGTLTANGVFTLGDGGDAGSVNTNTWDISAAGVASGLTGLTSSGTVNFSGLTASRALFTDASSNLAATGTSAMLLNALSDETGSGAAVFGTTPTFTTSIIDPLVIGGTAVGSSLALQSTSGVGTTDYIKFTVGDNGGTEAMRIINSGNVGIGTNAPGAANVLDIYSGASHLFYVDTSRYTYVKRLYDMDATSYFAELGNSTTSLTIAGNISMAANKSITGTGLTVGSSGATVSIGTGGNGTLVADKITVNTVDPPYWINGQKYATYVPSMVGLKEEMTSTIRLAATNNPKLYKYVIDFDNLVEGSQLWLFSRVIDLDPAMENLTVLLSSDSDAKVFYKKDLANRQLIFFGTAPAEISYRLTALRFDHEEHPHTALDQDVHGLRPGAYLLNNTPADANAITDAQLLTALNQASEFSLDQLGDIQLAVTLTPDQTDASVTLRDDQGQLIERFSAFTQAVVGKLRVGFIQTNHLSADSIAAPIATFSAIKTQNLVSTTIATQELTTQKLVVETATISGTSRLGTLLATTASISGELTTEKVTATQASFSSGRIAYLETKLAELATAKVDSFTAMTATISGTLYATNIADFDQKVADTFRQPSLLANLFGQTPNPITPVVTEVSQMASSAGQIKQTLAELSLNETDVVINPTAVFIKNYFEVAGNSYLAGAVGIGGGLVIGDGLRLSGNELAYQPTQGGETVFKIQPSGLGKLDLMAGRLTITATGLVELHADLRVAGATTLDGVLDVTGQTSLKQKLTTQGDIEIVGSDGGNTTTISTSGAITTTQDITAKNITTSGVGQFKSLKLASDNLINSGPGTVTTSQATGKARLLANQTEIILKSELITSDTLIYVTPNGSTSNQVLFVKAQTAENTDTPDKEGEFKVAMDQPLAQDVDFTWWLVN